LFATYQSKGPGAITQMGALVQLFAKSKGNANEALTSIQGVFATFADKKKVEFLDKQGINVFKKGTTELREPVELLLEVLDKAKNDPLKLGDVFDQTSLQGLASLYGAENKQLLKYMVSGNAELGATQGAAAKNAATFNSATTSLHNSFNKFANAELAEPIKAIADAINGVDQESIDKWLKWGEAAALAVGGVIIAKKALDAGMWAKKTFGAGGLGKGGKGGGIQSLGATPVYVVNMGKGGLGGVDALGESNNTSGKKSGRSKALLKNAAAATIIYPVADSLMDAAIGDSKFGKWAKKTTLGDVWDGMFSDDEKNESPKVSPLSRHARRKQQKSISQFANDIINDGSSVVTQTSPGSGSPIGQTLNGQIGVSVEVLDNRVIAKTTSNAPFLSINSDPDAGLN